MPPNQIYIHPDKQAYMIEHNIKDEALPIEKEWVLPMALGDKWTLKRFAEIFDSLPDRHGSQERNTGSTVRLGSEDDDVLRNGGQKGSHPEDSKRKEGRGPSGGIGGISGEEAPRGRTGSTEVPQFGGKRILLAMVTQGLEGGDGTVVYYFMGEGEVKPRQN